MSQFAPVFQTLYPNAFRCLSERLPATLDDDRLRDAFLANSHLDIDQARAALTMGQGAPFIFAGPLGPATWGLFDPDVPARIVINREVFEHFEQQPGLPEARTFLCTKALHETCHWGCALNGVPDPDVAGEQFEKAVFGEELDAWWRAASPADSLHDAVLADASQRAAGESPPSLEFTDADARAAMLRALLPTGRHALGSAADPAHAVFGGVDVGQLLPRGYRTSNPGNIRASAAQWLGLADPAAMTSFQQKETAFCVFIEPEWGLRAIGVLLRAYQNNHGLRTPRALMSRWAPAGDNNDVVAYANAVARTLGASVGIDDQIDLNADATLMQVIRAIARHENGVTPPYAEVQFKAAMKLLG